MNTMDVLDDNSKAVGKKVIIKKKEYSKEVTYGEIIVPNVTSIRNAKLEEGTVTSIGSRIKDNVKVGDTVLYDKWSVFYDHPEYVVTNFENIIMIGD